MESDSRWVRQGALSGLICVVVMSGCSGAVLSESEFCLMTREVACRDDAFRGLRDLNECLGAVRGMCAALSAEDSVCGLNDHDVTSCTDVIRGLSGDQLASERVEVEAVCSGCDGR